MFLKVAKLDKSVEGRKRRRKTVPDPGSLVKNCEFLDIRVTGMHVIVTGCSCVISVFVINRLRKSGGSRLLWKRNMNLAVSRVLIWKMSKSLL